MSSSSEAGEDRGETTKVPPAVALVGEQVGNSFALVGAAQRRDLASLTVSLLRSHAADSLFHKDDFDGQLAVGGGRGSDIPPLPEEHGEAREERSVLIVHGGDGILLGELGKRVVAGAETGASRKKFSGEFLSCRRGSLIAVPSF